MKKFLFTLAAMLMAVTAFADNKFYIEDVELTQEQLGQPITLQVLCHLDAYMNTYEIHFAFEGDMTYDDFAEPNEDDGAFEVDYINQAGKAKTADFAPNCMGNVTAGLMGFSATAGYWQDPNGEDPSKWVSYGAVKWEPGDYSFYYLTITPSASFTGGKITLTGFFSAGNDTRPIETVGANLPFETVCNITVKQDTPPAQPAPVPTFDWSDQSFTMEAVCENHTVVLMKGDEIVSNPFTVTQTYEEQEITFKAYTVANDDESGNSAVIDTTVVVPAMAKTPSNKPTITVTPGDDVYTIEATGTGTVELYINGEKVEGTSYTVNRPAYGEDPIEVEVTATNLDSDPAGEIQYEVAEDSKTVTVPAKEPEYYQTPDPKITVTVDNENEKVIITATGEGTVTLKVTGANGTVDETSGQGTCSVEVPFGDAVDYVNAYATATAAGEFVYPGDAQELMIEIPAKTPTLAGEIVFSEVNQENGQFTVKYVGNEQGVTITLDDETITLVRDVENKYQLPTYGTYPVTATASATGYKPITKDATLVWTKPATEKPGVPEVNVKLTDESVTVSAEAENATEVKMYLCDENGELILDEETNEPIEVENPSTYMRGEEDKTFYVMAVAINEAGETWIDAPATVVVPAKKPTSVNELVNGKTVAGVRYFNMAGQEMQEANGITIVVTTYTDGTTSAVKVIK